MPKELYIITYSTASGDGLIQLDASDEKFTETLKEVEQKLADTGAKNIVYTHKFVEDCSCETD